MKKIFNHLHTIVNKSVDPGDIAGEILNYLIRDREQHGEFKPFEDNYLFYDIITPIQDNVVAWFDFIDSDPEKSREIYSELQSRINELHKLTNE